MIISSAFGFLVVPLPVIVVTVGVNEFERSFLFLGIFQGSHAHCAIPATHVGKV